MKIKEIGKVVTGKTPPTKEREYFEGDYPFITPSDIPSYEAYHLWNTERYLSQSWADKQPKYLLPPESICYVCIGSTVGKICMTKSQSFTNQQLNSIICNRHVSNPFFVYYKLVEETPKIQSIAGARGSGKSIINKNDFENLDIDMPTLSNQHKIASILSTYDDLIENNNRRIKILEEMAQTIYNEWFVKFRFPGYSKVKMMDSELGKIPEGWEVKRLNEIIDIFSGFAFKSGTFEKDARYGLVTIKNVQAGLFVDKCQSYIKELPKKMPDYCFLSNGDMLLSLTGNVGRVCLVYGTDYILNQRVAKIVPKEVDNKAFVYCLFLQSEFRLKLEKISTGVAQQNLSPIEMGKIKVIVPKEEVLRQFGYTCNPMLEEIALMFRKNAILRETRDVLLPKLISGEIDVEHLDIKTEDIE